MRTCGRCGCHPRQDDPLQVVQWDAGIAGTATAAVCRECEAAVRGEMAAAEATYPVGSNPAFNVCGVCRLALRDDDSPQSMRLAEADIIAAGSTIKPGCYASCRDCVERFRPLIYDRLTEHPEQRNNAVLPPFESFGGQWLQ